MKLNVPQYDGNAGERVTSTAGVVTVHGYEGEPWYRVVTSNFTNDDIQLMLSTRPQSITVVNDGNIAKWRESVTKGDSQ